MQYWHALQSKKLGIKFFNDYTLVVSEAKNKTSGKGLNILTPKQ